MSVYRNKAAATCSKCGSSLAGRFVETRVSVKGSLTVKTDVFKCRCGGGRRIARGA